MKMYSRVYFLLCLFLAITGRSRTQRKLNPREKFPIYGIFFQRNALMDIKISIIVPAQRVAVGI